MQACKRGVFSIELIQFLLRSWSRLVTVEEKPYAK